MPPSILVLGAGELGTAILTALTTHYPKDHTSPTPPTLSVLRRAPTLASPSPETQASLARLSAQGITFETGDFVTSPIADLAAIFKKYDVVIQAGGFTAPRGTLLRVAEAVLAAGVKRFVPWQFGVDYEAIAAAHDGDGGVEGSGQGELFAEMLAVRGLLRGQGRTGWTVISTGLFMSFLFLEGFGVVDLRGRVVRALGGWGNRVTVTEVEGIGRMVAEVVYNPGGSGESKVVHVAGDTVSYRDIADVVEGVYGGGFEREVWDMGYLRKRLEEKPEDVMLKYQNVFGAGVGVSWEMERTLNFQRGIKLMNLGEFVSENKDILAASAT